MYANKPGSIVHRPEEVAKLKEPFRTPAINIPTPISVPSEGGRNSNDRESQSSSSKYNNNSSHQQGSNSNHYNNNHNTSYNNSYNSNHNNTSSNHHSNYNNRYAPAASTSTSDAQWSSTPKLPPMDENESYGTDIMSREERRAAGLDDKQVEATTSNGGGARAAASRRLEKDRGTGLQREKTEREKEQDERDRKETESRQTDTQKLHELQAYGRNKNVVSSLNKKVNAVASGSFYQAPAGQSGDQSKPIQPKRKTHRPLQDRYKKGTTTAPTLKRKLNSPPIDITSDGEDGYITDTIPTKSTKLKKKSNSSPTKSSKVSKPPKVVKLRSPTPPPSRTPSPEPLTLEEQIAKSRRQAKIEARKEKKEKQKARAIRKEASLARRKKRNLEDGDFASDSESEVASNSDDEEEQDSQMREETPDDLLMSEDEAPDPSTLCPFCSRSLPKNPSKQLKRLKTYLLSRPHILPKPTVRNPEGKHLPVIETASFCTRHVEETTIIPQGIEKGYPEKIDFSGLKRRISRDLFSHLTDVINGDFDSKFFVDAKKEWENQKGSRKMNNILSEWGSFDIEQPGYYGTQGLEIMISTLRKLFLEDTPLLTIVRCAPLDIPAYLRRVLVPECAVELIRKDLGEFASREEAEKVCEESRDYGKAVFGTSEEEEKFGRDEDRRDEQEEKEELERKSKKVLKDKKIQGEKLRKAEELDKRRREMEAAVQPERDLLATSSGNKRVPKQKLAAIAAKEAAEDQSVQKKQKLSSITDKAIRPEVAYRNLPSVPSSSSNGEKDWKRKMGPKNSDSSDDDDDDDEVIVQVPKKKPKLEESIKKKEKYVVEISSSESE